jgi:hypothetical protein
MVDQQNVAAELQGLIERHFDYMPQVARQEMQNDILGRFSEWLSTYKICRKRPAKESIQQIEDIESFLSVGIQGITGCTLYHERPDIQGIMKVGEKRQNEKKVCD